MNEIILISVSCELVCVCHFGDANIVVYSNTANTGNWKDKWHPKLCFLLSVGGMHSHQLNG